MRNRRPADGSERGAALALTVLWLPACLLAMTLAVDGARLFLARERAQHAAALGALAGAQELDVAELRRGRPRLDATRAAEVARAFALANWRANRGVAPPAGDERGSWPRLSVRVEQAPSSQPAPAGRVPPAARTAVPRAEAAVEVTLRAPVGLQLAGRPFRAAEVVGRARAGFVERPRRGAGKRAAAGESSMSTAEPRGRDAAGEIPDEGRGRASTG